MTIRIFFSPASPFVRKVMIAALERGVEIEKLASAAWPVKRDPEIVKHNPTGRVPAALLDDDSAVYDSRVIAALVDSRGSIGATLYPQDASRFTVLTLEALGDGLLEAALLHRYENVLRPEDKRWDDWSRGQMEKVDSSLDELEARWLPVLERGFHAGSISIACALGYLDFRFATKDWRTGRPKLTAWFAAISGRPSVQGTMPA